MKLWEAMKLLQEGKKVRCEMWGKGRYIHSTCNGIYENDGSFYRLGEGPQTNTWEEYIDPKKPSQPKLIELPPWPVELEVKDITSNLRCKTCATNYVRYMAMGRWIQNLYKEKG